MTTPTISSVTPSTGPTRGRRLVRIVGSNFSLGFPPPASGPTDGTFMTPVQVLFGTTPAPEVFVLSSSLIHAVSPANNAGVCDVTVKNLDVHGAPISGESATAAAAYTYQPADFTATPGSGNESVLAVVVRVLLMEMMRQLLANTVIAVHTDYDDTIDGANVAMLAKVPGIVLSGPTLRTNRFYSTNESSQVQGTDGYTYEQKPARTVDLVFTIIGAHNKLQQMQNFMNETVGFFEGNKNLAVPNPANAGEVVLFEMQIEKDLSLGKGTSANNSNVHVFTGSFAIIGVDLPDYDMSSKAIFDVNDVTPTASIVGPQGVIFTGEPGTSPAGPIQPNPPARVGNTGPFEQIPPPED